VKQAYEKAIKKYKPPEGMGPPRGDGMPPGGGGGGPTGPSSPLNTGGPGGPGGPLGGGGNPNLPAGGNLARGGQLPSNKMWGSLPNHFNGTRSKADDFIDKLKSYFCVNRLNAALQSPITKAAFALTLIKGPEVAALTQKTLFAMVEMWDLYCRGRFLALRQVGRNIAMGKDGRHVDDKGCIKG
jgi:hypothetical protein